MDVASCQHILPFLLEAAAALGGANQKWTCDSDAQCHVTDSHEYDVRWTMNQDLLGQLLKPQCLLSHAGIAKGTSTRNSILPLSKL